MSRNISIGGVIAAVLLPRETNGRPDWDSFEANCKFLKAQGVAGLCVNGATGEYAGATAEERGRAVSIARGVMGSDGLVVSGAGATSWVESVRLAQDAERNGADAHLVPAPHFFPYDQNDLAEFYRKFAESVHLPSLIYNLPAFTGGVEKELALELIREPGRIVGIKDSSGRLDILEALTAGGPQDAVRLVGNDAVLAEALQLGICGGAISGVACVLPELTLGLWHAAKSGDAVQFGLASDLLNQLLVELGPWPTPWGLKLVAEIRGLGPASIALPLSAARLRQAERFASWFGPWWAAALETLEAPEPQS